MSSAKLSGALLVWKGPPLARGERDLRAAEGAGERSAVAGGTADEPAPRAEPRPTKILWFLASGAAVVAVGGVIGLTLPAPDGATTATKPALSLPIPQAAAELTPTAIAGALRAPTLPPATIVLPHHDAEPATPPQATKAGTSPSGRVPTPAPMPTPHPAVADAPAESAKPAPAAPAPVAQSPLRARGDTLFATGHLGAARAFYERAAAAGDGRAALQLGESYDPAFLAQAGLIGERGNIATAAYWYHRAAQLGVTDAAVLLQAVMAEPGR
jgi:hypothetical protein